MSGGGTTHSRFKIPIDIDLYTACNIGKQRSVGQLLRIAKLIIWDEKSMARLQGIEALNDMLKDVNNSDLFFGGKVIIFGGDFQQIPLVITKGTKYDYVDTSLVKIYI